jgi:hypothetical protein
MAEATVPAPEAPQASACAQCGRALGPTDRVTAGDRSFCRSCYETLAEELRRGIAAMTTDVNYPMALVGAVLGGAVGVTLWWGITVLTHVAFGLVAVAIGWLVAQGAVRLAGNKRSSGLQVLSVVVSLVAFVIATYLVNASFINAELASRGAARHISFPPTDAAEFMGVALAGFGMMDLVFLGIMLWEAWRIPRPPRLPARAPA